MEIAAYFLDGTCYSKPTDNPGLSRNGPQGFEHCAIFFDVSLSKQNISTAIHSR